ncbi:MAG: hypothetical protein MUC34_07975 [Anaerolineae bacterium]|jgi:hypothetical protein|nr:hypothetical protein [Anaerolineae bacterium]
MNSKLGRIALALTTALALTLPAHSATSTGATARAALAEKDNTMTILAQPAGAARLDGLARSLMTRPAALLTSAERRDLADRYSDQIIARHSDLEAFARSAEFSAALAGGSVDEFVKTLSYLTLDATDNWTAIAAGPWTRLRNRIHNALPFIPNGEALLRYGSQGFAYNDKSNQPQHFWYSVAITYRYGPRTAEAVARWHEWNPPALLRWLPGTGGGRGDNRDFALSKKGIALGLLLRSGAIRPEGVGEWMRDELR